MESISPYKKRKPLTAKERAFVNKYLKKQKEKAEIRRKNMTNKNSIFPKINFSDLFTSCDDIKVNPYTKETITLSPEEELELYSQKIHLKAEDARKIIRKSDEKSWRDYISKQRK